MASNEEKNIISLTPGKKVINSFAVSRRKTYEKELLQSFLIW